MAYDTLASEASMQKTLAALPARNITPQVAGSRAEALEKVKALIPDGADVMTGGSTTLEEIGFTGLLKSGNHPWKNLKDDIVNEKDPEKQSLLRKRSVLSNHFLGSVHALTEEGIAVIASASGSQLPSYAFTSDTVIWVVGAQKIVPTLEEAFRRIREYVVPLEDARMKKTGAPGTRQSKTLVFEYEMMPRKIHLILVKEKLGF